MAELTAVLFDMDGTLTDTEKLWALGLDDLAAELGGTLTPELRAALVGLPLEPSIAILHGAFGIDAPWRHTADKLSEYAGAHYRRGIPLRPGALDLLTAVRSAGLRTALVTATERPLVDLVFETLGAHHFDVVVTGDAVTRGKPDPEPYQRAMDDLGVTPANAIAIEDSPGGTVAAVSAGLTVLVVPCEIPVPEGERRVFVDSLVGVSVDQLRSLPRAD